MEQKMEKIKYCQAAVLETNKEKIDFEKGNVYIIEIDKKKKAFRPCSRKAAECNIFCQVHTRQEEPVLFSAVLEKGMLLEKTNPFISKKKNGGRTKKVKKVVLHESSYIHKLLESGIPDRQKLLENTAEFLFKLGENEKSKLLNLRIILEKKDWTYDSDTEKESFSDEKICRAEEPLYGDVSSQSSLFEQEVSGTYASSELLIPEADVESRLKEILFSESDKEDESPLKYIYVSDKDESESGSEEDEEIECDQIFTKYGEPYYLYSETKDVYDIDKKQCGVLFQTDEKEHHIEFNGSFYTILEMDEEKKTGQCIFSGKIFTFEEIFSEDGKPYYLVLETMDVYDINHEKCGFLFETNKKDSHIEFKGSFYTIAEMDEEKKTGRCIFTGKIFKLKKSKSKKDV
jgi:hypothetical protein